MDMELCFLIKFIGKPLMSEIGKMAFKMARVRLSTRTAMSKYQISEKEYDKDFVYRKMLMELREQYFSRTARF